jgi:hypothetical protein
MTPGALFLGNLDQHFECGHEHAAGDRCVSFGFAPDYFERVAADAGVRGPLGFETLRLPPVRSSAALVARACAGLTRPDSIAGETGLSSSPWRPHLARRRQSPIGAASRTGSDGARHRHRGAHRRRPPLRLTRWGSGGRPDSARFVFRHLPAAPRRGAASVSVARTAACGRAPARRTTRPDFDVAFDVSSVVRLISITRSVRNSASARARSQPPPPDTACRS